MPTIEDAGLLRRCMALVEADPNPAHLDEYAALAGQTPGIKSLLDESLYGSRVTGYSERDGEALLCGIGLDGILAMQCWMVTTRNAGRLPAWLLREARRHLAAFDRFVGPHCLFWQAIPVEYQRGLHFVRHLGFRESRRAYSEKTGRMFVIVEREVPEWDS